VAVVTLRKHLSDREWLHVEELGVDGVVVGVVDTGHISSL
jgi:hypothetical protein